MYTYLMLHTVSGYFFTQNFYGRITRSFSLPQVPNAKGKRYLATQDIVILYMKAWKIRWSI